MRRDNSNITNRDRYFSVFAIKTGKGQGKVYLLKEETDLVDFFHAIKVLFTVVCDLFCVTSQKIEHIFSDLREEA